MKPEIHSHARAKCAVALLVTALTLFSCKDRDNGGATHPVLKVDLSEQSSSVFDIFKSVEVIPLETSEQSLFAYIGDLEVYEDKFFFVDVKGQQVMTFDESGRFIGKIHREGRGPGEYLYVQSFTLNREDTTITLLQPMGSIFTYKLDGTFIEQKILPNPPPNYQRIVPLADDAYVIYSHTWEEDASGVNILNAETMEFERGWFPLTDIGHFGRSLYRSGDAVYYQNGLSNKVYRIGREECEIAYEWDVGELPVDPSVLSDPSYTTPEGDEEMLEKFHTGAIPFTFSRSLQSRDYYFVSLYYGRTGAEQLKYVFYDKRSGKSTVFDGSVGKAGNGADNGTDMKIVHMTDNYALGLIIDNNNEWLQEPVSPEDAELLRNRKEDDNWWLVKYTFK